MKFGIGNYVFQEENVFSYIFSSCGYLIQKNGTI